MYTQWNITQLLKKEHIWVSSNDMDKTGAYYSEWSKSKREKKILYINTYSWNLERWYWWSYMQHSKEDTDIKNRLLGESKGKMIWENSIGTYTLPYAK